MVRRLVLPILLSSIFSDEMIGTILLCCTQHHSSFLRALLSFPLQNALMTFEEEKMAKSLTTLRAMEKRCSSNLSWSPSFTSFQSMKSKLWGSNQLSSASQSVSVIYFPQFLTNDHYFQTEMRKEQ